LDAWVEARFQRFDVAELYTLGHAGHLEKKMQQKEEVLELGAVKGFVVLEFIIGVASGLFLWPMCAKAFHGPFESAGFLILWPLSMAVALIPVLFFISGFFLISGKKAGIIYLYIANAMLSVILILSSLVAHFLVNNQHQARIRMPTYIAALCMFIFSIFSVSFFSRRRHRFQKK
jgi:hypothetical protein